MNADRHHIHALSNDGEELLLSLGIAKKTAHHSKHLVTPQHLAFLRDGRHLATWPGLHFPSYILIAENQDVWVADIQSVRIIKYDTSGNRLFSWDARGDGPGEFRELHEFGVDSNRNRYGADNVLGRSPKFASMPGADTAVTGPVGSLMAWPGRPKLPKWRQYP